MGRPERIGPYRIDARLGSGGMGEVYRAWDERLDRWVAIKVIRPDGVDSATARDRFRREARAAAAISHPAVVQIFDILEWEGGDAIVMELVAGESLASRISRGPVALAEALRIGRDVASGLAAAHSLGILHRDLKPENVMIHPEGSAKILDFGLSKRLGADASITEDNRVLGTFRCMSPEQVRNLPLDHRSDLFSLGTLLYETLSGRSPFQGSSVLETLDRICNHRQTPLRRIDPAVPEELSDLVDDLLQKDSMLRPRSAREVAERLEVLAAGTPPSRIDEGTWDGEPPAAWGVPASLSPAPSLSYSVGRPKLRSALVLTLLASLAALLLLWRSERPTTEPPKKQAAPPAPEPLYVAVPKPEILRGAGEEDVEMMAISVRENLLQGLISFRDLSPLASGEVDSLKGGSPSSIARATAAQEILSARLDCPGEICQVSLSRVAGRDGRLLWTGSFNAVRNQYALLPEVVRGYLQKAYTERGQLIDRGVPMARPVDYAEYLRLRRAWDVRQSGLPYKVLLARLAALRETSPRFVQLYLFESEVLEARYWESRNLGDLERAASGLRLAHHLVPADPRPLFGEFGLSLRAGRLDRAGQVVRKLVALLPGDPRILVCQGRLFEAMGKPEEAIVPLETAARRQPSWRNLFFLASAQYRLGRYAEARSNLGRLLERYPEHYDGQSLLAQLELLYGDVRRAVDLYQGLILRHPGMTELSNLGFAQLMLGSYGAAEESFRQALAHDPHNTAVQLNLADALSLQGKKDLAKSVYRQIAARIDPSSADVQDLSVRAQALAHLGENLAAVAAVQELLRGSPRSPQIAYEASLVYLLLGDRTAALFNATRALEQGIEPRYFDLPWFDSLRADPGFRTLLDRLAAEPSID